VERAHSSVELHSSDYSQTSNRQMLGLVLVRVVEGEGTKAVSLLGGAFEPTHEVGIKLVEAHAELGLQNIRIGVRAR
jgi:hypothetical protein